MPRRQYYFSGFAQDTEFVNDAKYSVDTSVTSLLF